MTFLIQYLNEVEFTKGNNSLSDYIAKQHRFFYVIITGKVMPKNNLELLGMEARG